METQADVLHYASELQKLQARLGDALDGAEKQALRELALYFSAVSSMKMPKTLDNRYHALALQKIQARLFKKLLQEEASVLREVVVYLSAVGAEDA